MKILVKDHIWDLWVKASALNLFDHVSPHVPSVDKNLITINLQFLS